MNKFLIKSYMWNLSDMIDLVGIFEIIIQIDFYGSFLIQNL